MSTPYQIAGVSKRIESLGLSYASVSKKTDAKSPLNPEDRTEDLTGSRSIELDVIIPDPHQPRKHFAEDELIRLRDSLVKYGQLQPIVVRLDRALSKYVVIAGERRYRAVILSGAKSIEAKILDEDIPPAKVREIQLVENLLREDLEPIEQAHGFEELKALHRCSNLEVATMLAISEATVAKALALLKLPEAVQARVTDGSLAPSVAYETSRIPDQAVQIEVADRIVTEKLKRPAAIEVVNEALAALPIADQPTRRRERTATEDVPGKAPGGPTTQRRSLRLTGGATVTVERKGRALGDAEFLTLLRRAVSTFEDKAVKL